MNYRKKKDGIEKKYRKIEKRKEKKIGWRKKERKIEKKF